MLSDKLRKGAGGAANPYIEDVFSTYLYTGTGSTQTITNGIDLSGEGGLVWTKARNSASESPAVVDTERGVLNTLYTNYSIAQSSLSSSLTAFNSNGYSVGTRDDWNKSGNTYVSWTFRKAEKFFDVVTYTGNGSTQNISHNLGSVPGCIIVKRINNASNTGWPVYHRYDYQQHGFLNLTNNFTGAQEETWFGNNVVSVAPTSTVFTVGSNQDINASSNTYVAYLFAHDAGGFGDDGEQNVISCGSYTEGSSDVAVTLGYEPAWIMVKPVSTSGNWNIYDTMRGAALTGSTAILRPNTADAEVNAGNYWQPTATGFVAKAGNFGSGVNMIYIAIRRGPMKTPESGTEVFAPNYGSDVTTYTTNFPLDSGWDTQLPIGSSTSGTYISARLVGSRSLVTSGSAGEITFAPPSDFWQSNTSYRWNTFGNECSTYAFRRAPSFFDVVCYTGNATLGRTIAHNLTIAPELMIVRQRTGGDWYVYSSGTGATKFLELNTTAVAVTDSSLWNDTAPTSSVFTLGDATGVNRGNTAFIAYLFATCPGVSKVFSYTGNGSSQTINCGFTSGARFILIKRTDSTGDWYVWDSARGIVAGNDPYYRLNSTSSEVTTNDSVDTTSTGFIVNQISATSVNVSSATYIGLAIA